LNKIDLLPDPEAVVDLLGRDFDDALGISAGTGQGLRELLDLLEARLNRDLTPLEALLPYSAGDLVNLWHVHGLIEQEEHTGEGVRIKGMLPVELAGRMRVYAAGSTPLDHQFT
ncbi:MAG TPA: GTPase HflX, partial [Anaerolineae bacterium]|nr:GTPase HflX [Anaerolineae bacterium]